MRDADQLRRWAPHSQEVLKGRVRRWAGLLRIRCDGGGLADMLNVGHTVKDS